MSSSYKETCLYQCLCHCNLIRLGSVVPSLLYLQYIYLLLHIYNLTFWAGGGGVDWFLFGFFFLSFFFRRVKYLLTQDEIISALWWVLTGSEKSLQCLVGIYCWSAQHNSFCFFLCSQMLLICEFFCSLPRALATSLTTSFSLCHTEALVFQLG